MISYWHFVLNTFHFTEETAVQAGLETYQRLVAELRLERRSLLLLPASICTMLTVKALASRKNHFTMKEERPLCSQEDYLQSRKEAIPFQASVQETGVENLRSG